MKSWRITTESGSLYELHELSQGEWVLTADNVPSPWSADLRGMRLPMLAPPAPWPPAVGNRLMFILQLPDRIKIRQTSTVTDVAGPFEGGEA